jgi:multidrug resistance efflux pump
VPVVLGPVQRGPAVVRQHLLGELTSLAESSVAAETAGTVEGVPARVGSPVAAGELLVQLDPQAARIAVDAARARLAAAQAEAAGRLAARDRLEADRARLGKVQGSQPDAVSAQVLQESELRLQEAQAALDAALANEELRSAELASARLELARCSLRSPVAGVVARQDARIGQRVAPGTVLVQVVATG